MGLRRVPAPPRPVRLVLRAVWPFVGVVVTGVMTPVVVAGALHSLVDRRARLFRFACLSVILMWVDIRMLLRCWALRRASPDGSSPTWREDHERLLGDALDSLMYYAKRWVGLRVELTERMHFGSLDEPLVALSRHAGPFDSLAVAWLLTRTAGRLPRVVLAEAMRWDPGIDTILSRLEASFVPTDGDRLAGVREMAATLDADDVFLLFPEGQNWSPSRRRRIISSLRRKGQDRQAERAERLVNVLPPKSRGAFAARAARPEADVMVIAHAGFGELTTLRSIWDAAPFHDRPFLVRTWTYEADTVPAEPVTFDGWLADRWTEVDAWVSDRTPGAAARKPGGAPDVGPA